MEAYKSRLSDFSLDCNSPFEIIIRMNYFLHSNVKISKSLKMRLVSITMQLDFLFTGTRKKACYQFG